jgi:hypothetical protein
MAAGIPPVVLANRAESFIVADGVTGIVAGSEREYVTAIEELFRNGELRQRLSRNAAEAARKLYSMDLMVERWEKVFDEILRLPKTVRAWRGKYKGRYVSPHHVYLESLGEHGEVFMRSINGGDRMEAEEEILKLYDSSPRWRARTRGTPRHYHDFFPEDPYLKHWSDILVSHVSM